MRRIAIIYFDSTRVRDLDQVRSSSLQYLLGRLLSGNTVALDEFPHFGVSVILDADMDQGPEA